jgi:spore coat protein U-like protein
VTRAPPLAAGAPRVKFVGRAGRCYDAAVPRLLRHLALALVVAAFALPARAGNCRIHVGALAFGTYDPFSPVPLDALGTVGYDCRNEPGAVIALGRGSSPTFSPRTLRNGAGAVLEYDVYVDAARTAIFGDGSAPGTVVQAVDDKRQTAVLYARIRAGQQAAPGAYSDTLVISILF